MDYNTYLLPIQSIWIEEDQFLEKVYGFHINQVLESEDHKNSNEETNKNVDKGPRIVLINSSEPHLGNKNSIPLNHTIAFPFIDTEKIVQDDNTTDKSNRLFPQKILNILRKNRLLNKFKKLQVDNKKSLYCKINSDSSSNITTICNNRISAPFQFQHISHGEDLLSDHNNGYEETCSHIPRVEDTDDKETYYDIDDVYAHDEECNETTESTLFSTTNSKNSTGFSVFCTPKLSTESTNSSRLFDLERNDVYKSHLSPYTVTSPSSLKPFMFS